MGDVVAGEMNSAIGFGEAIVSRKSILRPEMADPRAEIVRNMSPGDVDGFGEFLGVPWMQAFDGLTRSVELSSEIEFAKVGAIFDAVARNDYTGFGKDFRTGIPDDANGLLGEGDATVDLIVLLPETAGFPSDFVGGVVGGALKRLLDVGG